MRSDGRLGSTETSPAFGQRVLFRARAAFRGRDSSRRLLIIAAGFLSLVLGAGLWAHHQAASSAANAAIVVGLTLLIALPWARILLEPNDVRLEAAISPDNAADWLPMATRNTGYGVTISDAERRLVWVNESFTRMTGYTIDEALGGKVSNLIYFDGTNAETVRQVREAFAAVRGVRFEILVRSKNGREWWLDTDAQPLLDANGTLRGWACIQTDVTAEVLKREATRRDQSRVLTMIEGGNIGTWELDSTTNAIEANSVFLSSLGYAPQRLACNLDWLRDLYHPDDCAANDRGMEQIIAGRTDLYRAQHRMRAMDGSWKWFLGAVGVVERAVDGKPLRMFGVQFDITEHKLAERQRQIVSERLAMVADNVPGMIFQFRMDRDGRGEFLYASPGVHPVYGLSAEDLAGNARALLEITHPDDREELMASILHSRKTLDTWHIAHRIARPDGGTGWVEGDAVARRAEDGGTEWNGYVSDVTLSKHAQEQLRAAKEAAEAANRAKSEFLANMSHEIRTPLNGVIGMTGLLLDTALSKEQRELAEIARSSGESLLAVLNDVLDFSKIEAGQMTLEQIDFDLFALTDQAIDAVALRSAEKGLELIVDVDPALPRGLRGDPTRLRQVVLNLLSNAIKFTAKGEVRICVRRRDTSGDTMHLRVEIADTGVGLTAEQRTRLFMPFIQADTSMTRRFGGTGLGLSICRRLVELMGGSIGVDSVAGSGSCFWFEIVLPVITLPGVQDAIDFEECRVLVVDDHPTNRRIIDGQLTSAGCRVTSAATAADGEDAWKRLVAADCAPDVVLLDHDLPDHPGPWLAQRLRRDPAGVRVPIILMTSLGTRVEPPTEYPVIDRILTKPAKQSALLQCIQDVIGAVRATTAPAHAVGGDPLRRMRVLLAEDNMVNQKLARRILEKLGAGVTVADNGEAAIAELSAADFDVVLMDCQMPVLDGYEATRRIRAGAAGVTASRIPIIALTAHALSGDRDRCLAAGMNEYLTKPIDPNLLKSRLMELMGGDSRVQSAHSNLEGGNPSLVLDETVLRGRIGDDSAFMEELLGVFVVTTDEHIVALLAAATRGDAAAIAGHAHAIVGAASSIGAGGLMHAAAALERAAADPVAATRHLESLHSAWREFQSHPTVALLVVRGCRVA